MHLRPCTLFWEGEERVEEERRGEGESGREIFLPLVLVAGMEEALRAAPPQRINRDTETRPLYLSSLPHIPPSSPGATSRKAPPAIATPWNPHLLHGIRQHPFHPSSRCDAAGPSETSG